MGAKGFFFKVREEGKQKHGTGEKKEKKGLLTFHPSFDLNNSFNI